MGYAWGRKSHPVCKDKKMPPLREGAKRSAAPIPARGRRLEENGNYYNI